MKLILTLVNDKCDWQTPNEFVYFCNFYQVELCDTIDPPVIAILLNR